MNNYKVSAIIRFDELGPIQRLSLMWHILCGLNVTFNFMTSTIYIGDKQVLP